MSLFSKQIDKRIAAYQRELIETHYREVDNMYRQIRGWRHDYRNHIQTMKVLAANGDMDAIKAYLDELDTDLNTVDTVVKTGNAMADAILNSKISLTNTKAIRVDATARVPAALAVADVDLCVMIGNLLDNAMEACEALPEEAFMRSQELAMRADVMLVLGTSLTVFPAAGLPRLTLQKGGKVFIVNAQPTPLDAYAAARYPDLREFAEMVLSTWPES